MFFCSFQPYDWKTSVKDKSFKEIYEEELGFNPMYCLLAEDVKNTYIQMINICPVTPEKLLFFKTNDIYFVNKAEHLQALVNKHGKLPQILSLSGLKKWLLSKGITDTKDFINSFPTCCELEYLVNRENISIVGEINIRDRVSSLLEEDTTMINEIIKQTRDDYKKARAENPDRKYLNDNRAIRDGTAQALFMIYFQKSYFWEDYGKAVGFSPDISSKVKNAKVNIDFNLLFRLQDTFNVVPTKENLSKILDYSNKHIII